MNKQIRRQGSCLEMCAAAVYSAAFRAAYELCTFGWFSLKFSALCCRQGRLPTILFLRCSSYMTHLCLQQLATSPSKEEIKTSADLGTWPVLCFLPLLHRWWGKAARIRSGQLLRSGCFPPSLFNLLMSRRKSERLWENLLSYLPSKLAWAYYLMRP